MKTLLLFILTAVLVHAETPTNALPTTTITSDTKLEFTKSKGSVMLRAGTKVDVMGKEGDSLMVIYRNIPGLVPRTKTDFKDEPSKPSENSNVPIADPKTNPPPATPPPAAKAAEAKPVDANASTAPKAAAPSSSPATPAPSAPRDPTSMYGKAVKKARDNAASHEENLVVPTNEVVGAEKKK